MECWPRHDDSFLFKTYLHKNKELTPREIFVEILFDSGLEDSRDVALVIYHLIEIIKDVNNYNIDWDEIYPMHYDMYTHLEGFYLRAAVHRAGIKYERKYPLCKENIGSRI